MMRTLTLILAALFIRQSTAGDLERKAATTITTTGSSGSSYTYTSSYTGIVATTGSQGQPIITFATAFPLVTVVPFTTTLTPSFGPASGSGIPISANFTATVGVPVQGVITLGGNASSITPESTVTTSSPVSTSGSSTFFSTFVTTVPVSSSSSGSSSSSSSGSGSSSSTST
uniref:Cysteine protease ATG4 ) n=1 Tax=Ganoderma boninense TaxID=34458 RepID=A0A5K1JWI6_9APHY|nr:Cysteine protease ATG4 (EC (Autophagy-related protein 4) [Ganoderma boninense]